MYFLKIICINPCFFWRTFAKSREPRACLKWLNDKDVALPPKTTPNDWAAPMRRPPPEYLVVVSLTDATTICAIYVGPYLRASLTPTAAPMRVAKITTHFQRHSSRSRSLTSKIFSCWLAWADAVPSPAVSAFSVDTFDYLPPVKISSAAQLRFNIIIAIPQHVFIILKSTFSAFLNCFGN